MAETLKELRSTLRQQRPIDPSIKDFPKNTNILPEIEEELIARGHELPTLRQELKWMNQLKQLHSLISDGATTNSKKDLKALKMRFGNKFSDSYFNNKHTQRRWLVKNLKLYQENSSNENVRNTLLAGMEHIPLFSVIPSTKDNERGLLNIPIDSAHVLQNPGNPKEAVTNVPYSFANYPYLHEDDGGNLSYKYSTLSPTNKRFFESLDELNSVAQPFVDYTLYSLSDERTLPELMKARAKYIPWNKNELGAGIETEKKEGDEGFDPANVGLDLAMGEFPTHKKYLARVVRSSLGIDAPETAEETLKPDPYLTTIGNWPDGVTLEFSMQNLFSDLEESEEEATESEEETASKDAYWAQFIPDPADRTLAGIKRWVKDDLERLRWENMPDDEKKQLQQFVGSIAQFYKGIPTDLNHMGSFVNEATNTYGLSQSTVQKGYQFLRDQTSQFQDELVMGYNIGTLDDEHQSDMQMTGEDYLQKNRTQAGVSLMKAMQRMMKAGGKGWPKPDSGGFLIENPDDMESAMRMYDAQGEADELDDALGMSGSSPERMDEWMNFLVHYLELENLAGLEGAERGDLEKTAGKLFSSEGKIHAYDFRRGRKYDYEPVDPANLLQPFTRHYYADRTKSELNAEKDPTYMFFQNTIKKFGDYAYVSGMNGDQIQPVIEWMGRDLRSTSGHDMLVPLRVNAIRLVGTDLESMRELPQFKRTTIHKLFGKPLREYWIGGSSALGAETEITKVADKAPSEPKKEVAPTPPKKAASSKKKAPRKTKDTSIGGNKKK